MLIKKSKNQKILISSGPVWVPIDRVRVMTNVFGGALGYVMAEVATQAGFDVTLVMGPGRVKFSGQEKFKLIKFKYYDEVYKILEEEIQSRKYDVMIHSAAIPDYLPKEEKSGKIKSGKDELVIKFKPTKKIVDEMKKWDPDIFLVKFKLEVNKAREELIDIAHKSMMHSNADLMVANDLNDVLGTHKAFIIDRDKNIQEFIGKEEIAKNLIAEIQKQI